MAFFSVQKNQLCLVNENHSPMLNEKLVSVAPVVAALVAFLSVSTMLRIPGLPIGVSELVVLFLAMVLIVRSKFLPHFKHPLMVFWVFFIVTALAGFITGSERGEGWVYTGAAYLYVACFTMVVLGCAADLERYEFHRYIRAMVTIPVFLLFIPLSLFFSGDIWLSGRLGVSTDFYPSRVAAWSVNPNQLALFLLPLPFWLAAISQAQHWSKVRIVKMFVFLWFLFFLGFCVRSDALLLAWCIGIPVLTVLVSCWLKNINWRFFTTMLMAFLLAFVFFKCFFDGVGQPFFDTVQTQIKSLSSDPVIRVDQVKNGVFEQSIQTENHLDKAGHEFDGNGVSRQYAVSQTDPVAPAFGRSDSAFGVGLDPNKVDVRKALWVHALDVWKLSPIFGHGPGAFSYLDISGQKHEAHNLLLDMLTQVGVVGVALFGVMFLWLVAGAVKARDPFSLVLLLALIVFSGAHFILRQPVFMMYLVITAVAIEKRFFVLMNASRQ